MQQIRSNDVRWCPSQTNPQHEVRRAMRMLSKSGCGHSWLVSNKYTSVCMPHERSCRKWRAAAASSWLAPASRVALLPWVSGSGPTSVCDDYCLSSEVLQVRCVLVCVSLKRAHHLASGRRRWCRTGEEHLAAFERSACLQTIAGFCQTGTPQSALAGHR